METQLRVIDCEKLTRLDTQTAKLLDAKIKEAVGKLADDTYEVLRLLKDAKQGNIHEALGLSSWTEYISDVLQIVPADKGQRQVLVTLMSGEGMSQRAIASVLGVDQKTVSNDLRSGEENSSAETVGLDGKNYKRKPKGTAPKPTNIQPLNIAVSRVAALDKAMGGITSIAADDRFDKNRDSLACLRRDLNRAIAVLQTVAGRLGTES